MLDLRLKIGAMLSYRASERNSKHQFNGQSDSDSDPRAWRAQTVAPRQRHCWMLLRHSRASWPTSPRREWLCQVHTDKAAKMSDSRESSHCLRHRDFDAAYGSLRNAHHCRFGAKKPR